MCSKVAVVVVVVVIVVVVVVVVVVALDVNSRIARLELKGF